MANFTYITNGTCAQLIEARIDNGIVQDVSFIGGCRGNLQAVAALAAGRSCREVISLLQGIQCRNGTSCPDQLARALQQHCLAKAS